MQEVRALRLFLAGHACFVTLVMSSFLPCCSATPTANSSPREKARAVVIMLAKTTALADESCASLARIKYDAALAKKCADSYDGIRPLLIAAESGVDAWESGSRNQVACAVAKSASALADVIEAVNAAGGSVPLAVTDSLKFAISIVGECHGT